MKLRKSRSKMWEKYRYGFWGELCQRIRDADENRSARGRTERKLLGLARIHIIFVRKETGKKVE